METQQTNTKPLPTSEQWKRNTELRELKANRDRAQGEVCTLRICMHNIQQVVNKHKDLNDLNNFDDFLNDLRRFEGKLQSFANELGEQYRLKLNEWMNNPTRTTEERTIDPIKQLKSEMKKAVDSNDFAKVSELRIKLEQLVMAKG